MNTYKVARDKKVYKNGELIGKIIGCRAIDFRGRAITDFKLETLDGELIALDFAYYNDVRKAIKNGYLDIL